MSVVLQSWCVTKEPLTCIYGEKLSQIQEFNGCGQRILYWWLIDITVIITDSWIFCQNQVMFAGGAALVWCDSSPGKLKKIEIALEKSLNFVLLGGTCSAGQSLF